MSCTNMEYSNEIIKNSGCNFFATKRINKTAVLNKLRSSRATIQVWSTLLIVFIIIQSMEIRGSTAMSIQRARKKHIRSLSNHTLDWENPCGGRYIPDNHSSIGVQQHPIRRSGRQQDYRRAAFKILRRSIRNNIQNLKAKLPGAIDISDISKWSKLNQTYKFLPQIKPHSNITLTRWHRNVQVYIASFAILQRKQEQIDQKYGPKNRPLSKELHLLLKSARSLLCEIETSINATSRRSLQIISKEEMKNKTTLKTTQNQIHSGETDEIEVNLIDLKFVKARYNQFLMGTAKLLNRWLKYHKKANLQDTINDSSSNISGSYYSSNESSSNSSNRSGGRDARRRRKRRRNVRLIKY